MKIGVVLAFIIAGIMLELLRRQPSQLLIIKMHVLGVLI
ncbi:hypothetical protein T230_14060 [Tannerella sp. oral taxon BU063 isolate Cell 1/3]|uniref:Uncharacterized protein n=1 Tax=Tannerella sp. oral taxon BU063 isolate Cell 1/3 TaxID=1411022 RepID=W2CI35_9BACT|nr:hypothetical protein T230_14060 [Tannerella sp. oral taxon BU063 isolate Cell 1/3]